MRSEVYLLFFFFPFLHCHSLISSSNFQLVNRSPELSIVQGMKGMYIHVWDETNWTKNCINIDDIKEQAEMTGPEAEIVG